MLAANSGLSLNFSGSGIYASGEPLQQTFNPTHIGKSRVLVADLTTTEQSALDSHALIADNKTAEKAIDSTRLLALMYRATDLGRVRMFRAIPGGYGQVSVRDGILECSANWVVGANVRTSSEYALFAYSGNFRGELV